MYGLSAQRKMPDSAPMRWPAPWRPPHPTSRVPTLHTLVHNGLAHRNAEPASASACRPRLPSGDLHVAALLAQHRPRGLEDVRAEVVAALALLVGDGVQMRYAVDEVTFRLRRLHGRSVRRPVGRSVGRWTKWEAGRTVGRPGGRKDGQAVGKAVGRRVGRPDIQSGGRPVGRPAGRSVGRAVGRADGRAVFEHLFSNAAARTQRPLRRRAIW